LAQNHKRLHNKTVDYFFHQLVFLFMHKTYRPCTFSVLLTHKDLISENMEISK